MVSQMTWPRLSGCVYRAWFSDGTIKMAEESDESESMASMLSRGFLWIASQFSLLATIAEQAADNPVTSSVTCLAALATILVMWWCSCIPCVGRKRSYIDKGSHYTQ